MSKFSYSARSSSGEVKEGELEALSEKDVINILREQGYTPVKIKPASAIFNFSKFFRIPVPAKKVKSRELDIFFRQLTVLVSAGVPLLEALVAVEEQVMDENFRRVIRQVQSDIGSGMTFSQALGKHPRVFSGLTVAMIEAGEKSGALDEVLDKVTSYLEKDIQFRQKMQGALRYPFMVVSALVVAFIVLITFVIPKFSVVYSSLKGELPLPTRILIWISKFMGHYWWLIALIFIIGFVAFRRYTETPAGRMRWDQFLVKVPVFGQLIIKLSLSRFFRMLSVMISSGISITAALETTAGTADNMVVAETILRIHDRVVAGAGIAGPMAEEKIFPGTAVEMVAVGEKSGALDKMLVKTADYFDEETDYVVSNMMSLLEPILVFFMGMMVLVLALGVFLPMWSMMQLYSK